MIKYLPNQISCFIACIHFISHLSWRQIHSLLILHKSKWFWEENKRNTLYSILNKYCEPMMLEREFVIKYQKKPLDFFLLGKKNKSYSKWLKHTVQMTSNLNPACWYCERKLKWATQTLDKYMDLTTMECEKYTVNNFLLL